MNSPSLRSRILLPIVGALVIMMIAVAVVLLQLSANHSEMHMSSELNTLKQDIQSELFHHSEIIKGVADSIRQKAAIIQPLAEGDRLELLHQARALQTTLEQKHGITHFYFHDVQRRNLIRLCHPDRWGDLVSRAPLIEAEKSGEMAWGLGLGDCGVLSLSIVAPVYSEQQLVGYLEIGENIDRYTRHLQQLYSVESLILVEKSRAERSAYERKQEAQGRAAQWDLLPEQLITFWGRDELPTPLLQWLRERVPYADKQAHRLKMEEKHYHIAAIPLTDAANNKLAEAIIMNDVSEHWSNTVKLTMIILGGIVVIGALLMILLYWFLLRVERQIEREQHALVESESNLAEAQQIAHVGNWSLDLINYKIVWSDETFRILNLQPNELKPSYEGFLELIHPDDRDRVKKAYVNSVENKTPYNSVYRLLFNDGSIKHVSARCQTYYDEKGQALHSTGTIQDVTEQIIILEALRNEEARTKTLIDSLPQLIFMKDRESRYLLVNQQYANDMGVSPDAMRGTTDFEYHPAELAEKYRVDDQAIMDGGVIKELDEQYISGGI